MLQDKRVEIDGYTFTITKIPAERALQLSLRLGRFAGPIIKAFRTVGADEGAQLEAIGEAIEEVLGDESKADAAFKYIQDIFATGLIAFEGRKIMSIDELNQFDNTEPIALALLLAGHQIAFSLLPGLGKLTASLRSFETAVRPS